MIHCLFAALVTSVTLLGTVAGAQSAEDRAWQQFLDWLRVAPVAAGPLEMIEGYQKVLASKGLAPAEVGAQMNSLLRLMRERNDAWPLMFDKIYKSATPNFSTKPSALLIAAIEGRPPGKALDVGMGQGRNAIALAGKGWDVTGFDISAEGLAVAKAQAARSGVKLNAVLESDAKFDYGTNQWDLIAVIYGPGSIADPTFVERLSASLRPGGIVVVESFASQKTAARRRPVDIDPADLLGAFSAFRILRFEDADGVSDWDPQSTSLVRLIAQKRPAQGSVR